MRVLVVVENYLPDLPGGTERFVHGICTHLVASGVETHVVRNRYSGAVASDYQLDGVSIHSLILPSEPDFASMNGIRQPTNLDAFVTIMKDIRPDIVHFHQFSRGFDIAHMNAARDHGIVTLFTPHTVTNLCARGDLWHHGRTRCDGRIGSWRCTECYSHFRGRHPVLSSLVIQAMFSAGFAKRLPALNNIPHRFSRLATMRTIRIVTIANWYNNVLTANGISVDKEIVPFVNQPPARERLTRIVERPLRIAFAGRVDPVKGLDVMLDAAAHAGSVQPVVMTLSTGMHGPYYDRCKETFERIPAAEWHVDVPNAEVRERLAGCDAICIPSVSEMTPLVLRDAFETWTPVIASDIPPHRDWIRHESNGLLFPCGNVPALATLFGCLSSGRIHLPSPAVAGECPQSVASEAEQMLAVYRSAIMADTMAIQA